MILQSYSTSRMAFAEKLGTRILKLTGYHSGKLEKWCTQAIRKAKVSYFKEQFSLCGSNAKKFWKMVKDLENQHSSSQLPVSLNVDDLVVIDCGC